MNAIRPWTVALLLLASSSVPLAGCSKSKDSGGGSTGFVGITASRKSVVANGMNSVTLSVTDTGGGPVAVSTNRGQFSGGGTTATIPGAAGTLTLVTCNAASEAACAGTATVTASHGASLASVGITFGALAAVCSADCTGDPACPTHACVPAGGGTGTCSSSTPSTCVSAASCTPTETPENTCSDGLDNDCDGDVDCADSGCENQRCDASSPTFLCRSGQCVDTASGLAIQITPARTRLPANGTATTPVTVTVTSSGQAAGGMDVTMSSTLGNFAATTGTTDSNGVATFTFTTSATPGVATLTAQLTGMASVSRTATITIPALGTLAIGPVEHAVLGVKTSGFQESGYLSVLAKDDTGQPYPDGLAVRFEHHRLGGSTLGAPLTADTASCTASSGCVGYAGATSSGGEAPDTLGLATAWLYSGTVAGTLATTATATAGGVTRTITLPTVAVVGAKANGANFSVVCSPRNVPALAETDCAISLVEAPFTCEALLKDRYGNLLGTATQVIFESEAAAVGQVTSTPEYDPANPAADLGAAVQIFNTLGAGLPFDVDPDGAASEPSVIHGQDGCGLRTHNPRDGVVTIVAIADGEEAFFDANGNGAYDAGEPFVDQGEPFVDQNDDGAWNPGEWFLDVNGDGIHNGPNGTWDGATKIWTQTVVVYTGTPMVMASGADFLGTRWSDAPAGACTPTPAPTPFQVHPKQAGPPEVPPTSQTYAVYASDLNLNRLDAATQYSADVVLGNVKVEYQGLASYADDLGLFYRYWPCDQTGSCASQCRSTGAALPCLMTPSLSGYECGIASAVRITGGDTADAITDVVRWNVSTPYSVYGGQRTALSKTLLTGTNTP